MDPAGAVFTAAMLPVNSVRRTLGTFDFMDFMDFRLEPKVRTFRLYGPYRPSTRTEGSDLMDFRPEEV